jgi:hypothetical protein
MTDMGSLQRWDGFDAAVYKFTHECAEGQRGVDGHLRPAGRKLWAYGYMPAFFRCLEGTSLKGCTWTNASFRLKWKGVSCGCFERAGVQSAVDEILSAREPTTLLATIPRAS